MASALHTAWADVERMLDDNWPWTPIAWPGADFTPPTSTPFEWIRPTMLWGDGAMESMTTSGWNRVVGVLDIDLFDKPGRGYGTLRERADDIRDLFDRATAGAVEFQAASGPQMIGSNGGWIQVKVSIPFTVDETS